MVLTSDVSLIARAAKKSLENPNIHARIRGAIKEILNCIEYCPLYPKSETTNDFDILISLKRSAKTPEEKELIEKAWRIVRRAEVNAQIRELEESMEPEEVDLEEEEVDREEIAEEKQDSESVSKPTDLHQELTAVRKEFEEYKATNDAKLEALEQKVAQMALGSGSLDESDIVSEAWESSRNASWPKTFPAVTTEPTDFSGLITEPKETSGSTTEPKALSGSTARPTQAQKASGPANEPKGLSGTATELQAASGNVAKSTQAQEASNNTPKHPTPQQLQQLCHNQLQLLQNYHPISQLGGIGLSYFGPEAGVPSEALNNTPKGPTPQTQDLVSQQMQQLQQLQEQQYLALQNPQMFDQTGKFFMAYPYGAFSGSTTEPKAPSGSTARSTQAQKASVLINKGLTPQQFQHFHQQQYLALQTSQLINQLRGFGMSDSGSKAAGSSGLANGPKASAGSTTEPKETSGSTASPEMFPALLKQAQKAFSGSTNEHKAPSSSTSGPTQVPKASGPPQVFSGSTTEPNAPSGSTAKPESFSALLTQGITLQQLQLLRQQQYLALQNAHPTNQLVMEESEQSAESGDDDSDDDGW